jgi:hypothetical protein
MIRRRNEDVGLINLYSSLEFHSDDRLCGLVVRVPGYITVMYCDSCDVRTEFIYVMYNKVDRLCGLVVRVPGYTKVMYCDSCEVRTEFIYIM